MIRELKPSDKRRMEKCYLKDMVISIKHQINDAILTTVWDWLFDKKTCC